MKKSLLSVVVCVAVLLSAMFAMPVSAATEVDFLAEENMAPNGDGSFTVENGVLTFNAAAAAEEFVIYPATSTTLGAAKYVDIIIESAVKFDLCFRDSYTDKWIFGAGDFCWAFDGNQGASQPLPAGKYYVRLDLTGAYTWNNTPYENATLDMIAIIAKEPGTIVVSELVQNDGSRSAPVKPLETNTYTSPRYEENAAWTKIGMLNSEPTAWKSVDAESKDENQNPITSSAVIAADGNGISVSTTNGLWPSATYDYSTPFLVDYETTAIEVSFSIWHGKQSKFLLFYGNSTTENYESEEYVALAPLLSDADQNNGHYVLNLMLKDLVKKESVDENGKVKLNGIKAFAIGADKCVTVNAMNLLVVPAEDGKADVGGEQLDVKPADPPAGNGGSGIINNGGNNSGNNANTNNGNGGNGNANSNANNNQKPGTAVPPTGDNTNAIVFAVVAAAAAGVVTLSIVSKKAKAN